MLRIDSRFFGFCVGLSLMFVTIAGCGKGDAFKVYPTSGKVTYKGEQLENADVVFSMPGNVSKGEPSTILGMAKTDASGKYSIKSFVGADEVLPGAAVGSHTVTLSKFIPPKGMTDADYNKAMEAETNAMNKNGFITPEQTAPQRIQFLPPKYTNPTTSGLTAVVAAGSPNEFNFDLK